MINKKEKDIYEYYIYIIYKIDYQFKIIILTIIVI